MKIMKFGGASFADGQKFMHVAEIIRHYSEREKVIVVVSAMAGVTDKLIETFRFFNNSEVREGLAILQELFDRHADVLEEMRFEGEKRKYLQRELRNKFGQLVSFLTFRKKYLPSDSDFVVSFGERLSCFLMVNAMLKINVKAEEVDSARLIVTTEEFGGAKAVLDQTQKKAEKILLPILIKGYVPIVTGFYGATKDGYITTLGRGGSDYSATLLAYALDAQEVILWKEVNGIYSSDPKKGNGAKFIPELSYKEAEELAKNGAKVLHPEAIVPLIDKKIVVWVKNTFQPEFIGSKIWEGRK